jgi:hypothetical protein
MVQTVKYTAKLAMERSLALRALVMAMLLPWYLLMENQPSISKLLSKYFY